MAGSTGRRRLVHLMAAGLVDSLVLSVAWTVVVLEVVDTYGLAAAGLCSAAMLAGVALSAPVASRMSQWLDGRRLLQAAAGVEAGLRIGVLCLLFTDAPLWLLALCISAMNVTAWTGYAGMRAEVAAVDDGPAAMTWYGTVVAAVEALGVAVAALLPPGTGGRADTLLLCLLTAYVLSLVPTAVVASGSRVPRARVRPSVGRARSRLRAPSTPVVAGVLLMFAASAPTLLSVALAAELYGRSAVALAAVSFTVGSLAAPGLAARIQRGSADNPVAWALCAAAMLAGWVFAPLHVGWLCLAQLMSGLSMTALEGLLDTAAARTRPAHVTGALARATAGRALGSAAGTAVLPLLVVHLSLATVAAALVLALVVVAMGLQLVRAARRRADEAEPSWVAATAVRDDAVRDDAVRDDAVRAVVRAGV